MINEPEFKGKRRHADELVRILLVEDDPQFADLVQTQLRRMRWVESRLEIAGTLADALSRLKAEYFGLVIADLNLPDSSGLETIARLTRAGDQPVIVLTGDVKPQLRASAIEAGAYDFLHKDQLSAAALERLVRLGSLQAGAFRLLRDSESRFRSLLDLSSDFYWESDPEHRVVKTEHGSQRHPAVNPAQLGKPRWEMPSTHPDAQGWAAHRAAMEAHQPFKDFQIARRDDDGVERWRSISGEPAFDERGVFTGYRGIGRDITAQKSAEEDLRRFRLALDTSPDMILLIDRATMRHVDVNTTACSLLGYSREELLQRGPQDLLPLGRAELETLYDRLIADPTAVTGMRSYYRCKDGSRLPFESTRRVLSSGGRWVITIISRDIRERIAAEEALRASEVLLRQTFELAASGIAHVALDGLFLRVNPKLCQILGYAEHELIGRSVKEISHPADRDITDTQRARVRSGEAKSASFEKRYLGKDGSVVWVSLTVALARDERGEPQYEISVLEDITARKQSEEEVARLGRMYRALGAANEAILRATSQQEVFDQVCEIAVAAGGFVLGTVHLLDGRSKQLSRAAASGSAAALKEQLVPSIDEAQPGGKGLIGHACRTGQPAISNDYAADPRTQGRVGLGRPYEVGSVAVFPLRADGELAGVFRLQHAKRHAFTEELTALLQRLADSISFSLENFRREKRRRRTKRKLGESEQRFRSLTGLSSDVYWEQDAEYRFTSFSDTASDRVRPSDRTIGKRRWERHYFNMSEADWAAHRAALDARQPFRDLELGRVSEAGEKVWISVSGEPFFDDTGRFTGYRGVGRDITARKRVAQLRELEHTVTRSLAQTDSLHDALRGAIRAVCETEGWEVGRYFTPDPKAGGLRLSAAWGVENEAVQGFIAGSRDITYAPGQGLTGRVWESGHPLWIPDVSADGRSAQPVLHRASGMRGAFVFPAIAEGKTIGVLGFNSRDLRQPDEALLQAIGAIGNQIGQFAQRKQAEEVLRESEERFRSLTALSADWFWETDAEHRFIGTPPRVTEITGYQAPAYVGKRRWEVEGLSPPSGDWSAHRQALERRESYRDFELVQVRPDGSRVYLQISGEPLFHADGQFKGYRGTARDITRQRRGEEDLRRFRAAMDMSHDAIYLTDRATMRFVDVNQVACRSLGYTREQLIGMGPHEVLSAPRDQLEGEYDAVIAAGSNAVRVESSYIAKDGRQRWSELHRRALRSGDNWIIVTISRDITERKRAEERQAAHSRFQERIARFGQAALVKRDPADLIDKAAQALLEALAADAVAYLEAEPGAEGLVQRALVGVADPGAPPGTIACPSGSALAQVMQSSARVMTPGDALPLAWAHELGSIALIPVRGEERVRGVLCAGFGQPDAFAAEELNFVDAAASILSTALQRIDSEARLAYLAQFDPLTGLPNRALLADRFSQMIVQAKRRGALLAVLFIDLDGFKSVNDTLGHAGGDALLKEVAVRLQSTVRGGDTVARISGDEFAVVLGDLARTEDAALVAQKAIDRIAATVDIGGKEVFVTASVGIAAFPGDGADADTLIAAADAAMYRAKQSGRNAYQFFTAEINQRTRARARMGTDLRRALEREEFALVYQPKVELADRRMVGAEALLRWKHPERGMVSPAEFVPVLEETGLIVPVGDWVLRRACQDLKAWQSAGLGVVPVAVNLSARQFRQQDLDTHIKSLVATAGIDAGLIELEITESQLMQDPDQAIRVMRSLRDAGIRIAIDDFGTGYSSLSILRRFPVAALKIDRSFVKDMTSEGGDASIVRTVIEMAYALGFTVVAEGVETEDQAKTLYLLRCQQAQGYLFARPMPGEEFSRRLERRAG